MSVATAERRSRRPWAPDHNDHAIFDLVRMKGKAQEDVAAAFGIHQGTVSRIVQRYLRWQARTTDREAGRLAHAERLRSQRWLTYERNELFLAGCVRIAGEMENCRQSATTTVEHGQGIDPDRTSRTHYEQIDRSGVAARFYRLAFRINMEQLKLVSLDELPPLPPLSDEELAEEEQAAADATAEIRESHERTIAAFDAQHRRAVEQEQETERLKKIEEAERLLLAEQLLQARAAEAAAPSVEPSSPVPSAHNAHTEETVEIAASTDAETPCSELCQPEKKLRTAHDARRNADRPRHQPPVDSPRTNLKTPRREVQPRALVAAET